MNDPRKAIFAAVRAARHDAPFSIIEVGILDRALDQLNVPRAEAGPQLQPSKACFDIIKEFEGCRHEAYPDPGSGGDPWTIGYGATGPGIARGVSWTQEQCDQRLEEDVRRFANGVARAIDGAATSQQEFDAMVSLAFNIGLGAFLGSTLLRKHKAGDKAGAAAEFAKWNRASGRVMAGLSRRRAAEQQLYRGAK